MSRRGRAGLNAQVKRDLEEDFGDEIALSFSGKGSFLQVEVSLERGAR